MADSALNPTRPWPFVVEPFPAEELLTGTRVAAEPVAPAENPDRKEAN